MNSHPTASSPSPSSSAPSDPPSNPASVAFVPGSPRTPRSPIAARRRRMSVWLPASLVALLTGLLLGGCAAEANSAADPEMPDPNALPTAWEPEPEAPIGERVPPRQTDASPAPDASRTETAEDQPIADVPTDAPRNHLPSHLLSVTTEGTLAPPLSDGTRPPPKSGTDEPKEVSPPKSPDPEDDTRAPLPPPEPKKPTCKLATDCPVVANGCIVMGCDLDASGEGTCSAKAFVCQCLPGQDSSCDDNNPCTSATCTDVGACSYGLTSACNDGNACTTDTCTNTAIAGQPNYAVCGHKPTVNQSCDDGDPCTGDSSCKGGGCSSAFFENCDDGKACTFDVCIAGKGCVHTPTGPCE